MFTIIWLRSRGLIPDISVRSLDETFSKIFINWTHYHKYNQGGWTSGSCSLCRGLTEDGLPVVRISSNFSCLLINTT